MSTRDQKRGKSEEPLCVNRVRDPALPSASRISGIQNRLLHWYAHNDRRYPWRRKSASKYQRVIAEVLLQRTKADVVARMFDAFVRRYPSWTALSKASDADLQEVLRPLGLWQRRAHSMAALAKEMARLRGRFPKERHSLEELPGVGQYICNAILMFDQGACHPLLDANLARVLERLFGPRKLADIRYDPYLQALSLRVVSHATPASVNWAFLDLASLICTIRSPRCAVCPLQEQCCYASTVAREQESA
jgi:A/G-specific adenine glycosylase